MSKIKQSPKLPAEERRQQLLMSAKTLIAKKGYRDTTAEEIARRAKLTKGALYFHFKNKEDILFELVKLVMGDYKNVLTENIDKLKSPGDFLRLFFEPMKSDCGDDDLCQNLDFWVQAMSIPKIKKFMNRHFDEMIDIFSEVLGPVAGRTKKERTQMGLLTFALIDGLMVRQVMNPSTVDIKSISKLIDSIANNKKV